MTKRSLVTACVIAVGFWAGAASASPGLMQLAVRSGFWSNQFPDTAIMLQHLYYNTYDEVWDGNGNKQDVAKTKITANFTRLIRPWHFGDEKQYQFILEAILPFANVSWEEEGATPSGHVSGMMDPMLYLSLGWNNPAKTTHVQGAVVAFVPVGDTDLSTDAWAFQPIVALQQHIGSMFQIDASLSYQIETKKLDGSDDKGRNYFEFNFIPSVKFGGGWDVFGQYDYVKYQESETAGRGNSDDGFNHCVALGINNWFRPNMQLGIKFEKDIDGENTPASQGFNMRFLWIF